MKRLEANRLRFEIGELAGYLPSEFVWEQRLLGKIAHNAEFFYCKQNSRTRQVDRLRFVVDSGNVFCDVEPHDLPNDWTVPIDEAVAKAVAAVKRIIATEEFQHFVNAFHTLRYLEPFLDRWSECVRKELQDCTQAWAAHAARQAVKASLNEGRVMRE
jgi:histone H3/H4